MGKRRFGLPGFIYSLHKVDRGKVCLEFRITFRSNDLLFRAVPAHVFGFAPTEAGTLCGHPLLRLAAEGGVYLLCGDWCEPSRSGLRIPRWFAVRAARIFDSRNSGQAPVNSRGSRWRAKLPSGRAADAIAYTQNDVLNQGYAYATIISSKYHGQTLLSHLASLYPHSTLQAWQQKLNNGEVTLDGHTATGRESVTLGQTLIWNRPPWIEPDAPQEFEVLFEDAHLLAVNKPGGLPTLPGGGFMENTLLRLVQKRTPNANPVHRLGRATTGIVLFAKTPLAASNLSASWNTPDIEKIYRALSQNIAQQDIYEITTPIGLVPHPLIGSVWAANPSGKPSKSLARVISRSISTTTFEVSLSSGRPHQIRIHLASLGHPLVGDPLYGLTGQPLENLPGLPGDGGYFLHAQYLKFRHPITGEQVNLEAALPSGFPLH